MHTAWIYFTGVGGERTRIFTDSEPGEVAKEMAQEVTTYSQPPQAPRRSLLRDLLVTNNPEAR